MKKRVRLKMLLASASYTGNRLKAISDAASSSVYDGAFEFVNKVNQTTEYSYYSSGDLKSDRNKGIALVSYDLLGHPTRIQMTNGDLTEYVYEADGRKLHDCRFSAKPLRECERSAKGFGRKR